jgi:peptide deformylase
VVNTLWQWSRSLHLFSWCGILLENVCSIQTTKGVSIIDTEEESFHMPLRRILRIDDPEDKKILKTRCRPIKLPNPKLAPLIDDMFETMNEAHGVGLAAPQIGLPLRLAVIEIPPVVEQHEDGSEVEVEPAQRHVLINPRIVKMSNEEVMRQEGCLSLPLWFGEVPRATWVTVEYQDIQGKQQRLRKADELLGWAIQHEVDHLDGILFTERVRDLSTLRNMAEELEKQEQEKQHEQQEPSSSPASLPTEAVQ